MATRWTSKHTGQKIDDTIDCVCNPNLLDNWYFGNPVNQRGLMEYTEAGYTIDRWQSGLKVTIASNLITLQALGTYSQIFQTFELQLAGKIVTISMLIRAHSNHNVGLLLYDYVNQKAYSPDFVAATTANQWLLVSTSFRVADDAPDKLTFIFYPDKTDAGDQTVDILAAKLELGTQQTLAHKDANGNWVLNEIPDYGEQLARCQRHLFVPTTQTDSIYSLAIGVGTSTTTIAFFLHLPTTMRAKSSITFSGLHAVNEINSMLAITKLANYGQVSNGVWLQATVASGAEVGKAYYLRTSNPWSLVLDANL